MRIDYPTELQVPQLRGLFKSAFGDSDAFLDAFFDNVFSPDRCRCITVDDQVAASLYWLDCRVCDRPVAYLYAVATVKKHRGKGLCRALMENTHTLLQELGYAGCLLVPGEEWLFAMYETMGYTVCSGIGEFTCKASGEVTAVEVIDGQTYAAQRRQYLPDSAVIQEGENLTFLETQVTFYRGEDCIFCAAKEGAKLFCPEILGNIGTAPDILTALGAASGTFRTLGENRDFAMYHPLSDAAAPTYFAFAFD